MAHLNGGGAGSHWALTFANADCRKHIDSPNSPLKRELCEKCHWRCGSAVGKNVKTFSNHSSKILPCTGRDDCQPCRFGQRLLKLRKNVPFIKKTYQTKAKLLTVWFSATKFDTLRLFKLVAGWFMALQWQALVDWKQKRPINITFSRLLIFFKPYPGLGMCRSEDTTGATERKQKQKQSFSLYFIHRRLHSLL